MEEYNPQPIDTTDIELPEELFLLADKIAQNVHDVWASKRISEGWKYGKERNDSKKETPCLISYSELPESEKKYDLDTAFSTLRLIVKLGYKITKE